MSALLMTCASMACQTRGQAKVVAAGTASIALIGGYLEYRDRALGEPPLTAITAGTVAVFSTIGIFVLDNHPRILFDNSPRPWQPATHRGESELLAALRRSGCFGLCPAYRVAIYRDGSVEYVGQSNVRSEGELVGRIDSAQVSALEQQLVKARIATFDESYLDEDCTDLPTAHVWYRPAGGPTMSIDHYLGDRSAPKELFAIEAAIDDAIQIERWTGPRRGASATYCH